MTKPQPRIRPRRNAVSWAWQEDADCRGEALVLFFGAENERQPQRDIREREAKAVCAQCPVRRERLDYAVTRPEKAGMWGGFNEEERASERRRRMRRTAMAGIPAAAGRTGVDVPDEKRCQGCEHTKPAAEFYRDGRSKDGLLGFCKDCVDDARRIRQAAKEAVA